MRGPILLGRSRGNESGPNHVTRSDVGRHLRKRAKRQTSNDEVTATAASFFVPSGSLLGLAPNSTLTLFSGLLSSAPTNAQTDAQLFFLLVRNKHIADRERLVIWFNGGPGCSSFDGALMEIGPFRIKTGTQQLEEIDGAWNEYANVLFLDQPAGTGYSVVSGNEFVHELDDAADQVVAFLRRFYKVFPEFATMDTYLAGESYAGQYIPYTADAILKTTEVATPLKGLLIGNGWIDPWYQYPAYLPFAYSVGVLKEGSSAAQRVEDVHANCVNRLREIGYASYPVHEGTCEGILSTILDTTIQTVNGAKLCINTYDVRLTDFHPACGMNWPPDLSSLYEYLPRDDVKNAFHASMHEGGWVECSGQVGGNFWATRSAPASKLLPELLRDIPILLFAGDQDLICNWLGLYNMTEHMEWNGAIGFEGATVLDWSLNGDQVGTWQAARNLTFVKVFNASHMVPFDVPKVTHDMLLRFMNTDFISAAGSSAKIPSRIGSEVEAIVGETHPNGTALHGGPDDALAHPPPEPTKGAAVVEQTYNNAGSAALLVLLVLACAAIFLVLRARTQRGDSSIPLSVDTPRKHSRKRSKGSHRRHRKGAVSLASTVSEDPHELDELVIAEADGPDDDTLPRYRDKRTRRESGPLPTGEELFSVGDDEDEGADLGKSEGRDEKGHLTA